MAVAELGVFGGSGFYAFLEDIEHIAFHVRRILLTTLPAIPGERSCPWADATGGLSPSPSAA